MSKLKIEALLKEKGIKAETIEYQRSCPTPSGYGKGWDLGFSEKTEDNVWCADKNCHFETFMEFDGLNEVIKWIKTIPSLKEQ